MCRFNEAWRCRIVVESLPDLTNRNFEYGLADKGARPHGVEKFLFCDELSRSSQDVIENGESFGPEFDGLRASPQTLIGEVKAKGIEDDLFFVLQSVPQT